MQDARTHVYKKNTFLVIRSTKLRKISFFLSKNCSTLKSYASHLFKSEVWTKKVKERRVL